MHGSAKTSRPILPHSPPPSTRAGVDNANTNAPLPLRYVHRSVSGGDAEIYFVVNSNPYPVSTRATFRESTGRAEIWNPVSGERHAAGVLRNENGHATVELNLDAMESVFVVFRKKQGTSPSSLAPADDTGGADGKTLVLDGPWEVEFRPPSEKLSRAFFKDWKHGMSPPIPTRAIFPEPPFIARSS